MQIGIFLLSFSQIRDLKPCYFTLGGECCLVLKKWGAEIQFQSTPHVKRVLTGNMFSRADRVLHSVPHFSPVSCFLVLYVPHCFSTLFTDYTFPRCLHRLYGIPALRACSIFFPRFPPVPYFRLFVRRFGVFLCFWFMFLWFRFYINPKTILIVREAAVTICYLIFSRYRHGSADPRIYHYSYVVSRPLQSWSRHTT